MASCADKNALRMIGAGIHSVANTHTWKPFTVRSTNDGMLLVCSAIWRFLAESMSSTSMSEHPHLTVELSSRGYIPMSSSPYRWRAKLSYDTGFLTEEPSQLPYASVLPWNKSMNVSIASFIRKQTPDGTGRAVHR